MKRIFLNNRGTDSFIDDSVPQQEVLKILRNEMIFNNIDLFQLNERYSCTIDPSDEENSFIIRGDEDFIEVDLIEIKPLTGST